MIDTQASGALLNRGVKPNRYGRSGGFLKGFEIKRIDNRVEIKLFAGYKSTLGGKEHIQSLTNPVVLAGERDKVLSLLTQITSEVEKL